MDEKKGFMLQVISPDTTLFKGVVKSVSGVNEKGPFDILSFHTNFVSIIKGSVKINDINGVKKEIEIGSAILKAFQNTVYVFVGLNEKDQPTLSPTLPKS